MTNIDFFKNYGSLLHFSFNYNHFTSYGKEKIAHEHAQIMLANATKAGSYLEDAFFFIKKDYEKGEIPAKYFKMYLKYYKELIDDEDLIYKNIKSNQQIIDTINSQKIVTKINENEKEQL